jgi:hypothetical protein
LLLDNSVPRLKLFISQSFSYRQYSLSGSKSKTWNSAIAKTTLIYVSALIVVVSLVGIVGGYYAFESSPKVGQTIHSSVSHDKLHVLASQLSPGLIQIAAENSGNDSIISLNASLSGLVINSAFKVIGIGSINVSNPLLPNEIAEFYDNTSQTKNSSLDEIAIGSQQEITISTMFADGNKSTIVVAVKTIPNTNYYCSDLGESVTSQDIILNNSTNIATWDFSVKNMEKVPIVGLSANYDNSLWIPVNYEGAPVSDSNPLPVNATATGSVSGRFIPDNAGLVSRAIILACTGGSSEAQAWSAPASVAANTTSHIPLV